MRSIKAREGQWYADRMSHEMFCVISVDEADGWIDVRDRYGDIDEFALDEWEAMDLEVCAAPPEWSAPRPEPQDPEETRNPGSG
ncbi:MAG TPA: DUF6763 family protein [Steroidobacteraceae bacterium]|jgi:hypothetical protein